MVEVKGQFNTAICYTPQLDKVSEGQIRAVCDQEYFKDSKIRIMPDVHAGKGCTIGTTMTITDKVVPGMVGVDIGCGMETVKIAESEIDFEQLDQVIRNNIPSGRSLRATDHPLNDEIDLESLCCAEQVNLPRARRSIGTLGGGNHFIEVDKNDNGELFLVVHSGSRHLGNQVAKYYQEEGFNALCGSARFQLDAKIEKQLAYVEGELFEQYIHDMKIVQHFAVLNRKAMMDVILTEMGLTKVDEFTTIHNYIDTDHMILRKGSVSAQKGEKLLIPINMRDGSLVCIGKGNPEWNCSAPHGAGRLFSRKEASEKLSMEEYSREMEGIFTTCVNTKTLDESPMAYKSMNEIMTQIEPTAEIVDHIKPVYNYKASE